eukprot:jgi/Botrbrau1/15886/Bobra.40_1s0069.1
MIASATTEIQHARQGALRPVVRMVSYNESSDMQKSFGEAGTGELFNAGHELANLRQDLIKVADFGSAEGANSCIQLNAFVLGVRSEEAGKDKKIAVTHMDTPANNWNVLFETVRSHSESYRKHNNTYSYAYAGTFYEPCFPHDSLDLCYSSTAFHWGAKGPGEPLGDHMWPIKDSNPRISQMAKKMAAEQWLTILSLRATELRKGGFFVIIHMGEWGGHWLIKEAMKAWNSLAKDGVITKEERDALIYNMYTRSLEEMLEPMKGPLKHVFEVVSAKSILTPCAAYEQYKKDGDAQACIGKFMDLLMSTGTSTVEAALPTRSEQDRRRIVDLYFGGVRKHVQALPITQGMATEVNIVSLRKL